MSRLTHDAENAVAPGQLPSSSWLAAMNIVTGCSCGEDRAETDSHLLLRTAGAVPDTPNRCIFIA